MAGRVDFDIGKGPLDAPGGIHDHDQLARELREPGVDQRAVAPRGLAVGVGEEREIQVVLRSVLARRL